MHRIPHTYQRILLLLGWQSPALLRGIARHANRVGWRLDFHTLRTGLLPDRHAIDGIICHLNHQRQQLDFVRDFPGPVVDIGHQIRSLGHPRVLPDNHAAGACAARYFLERQYRTFAFAAPGITLDHTARERLDGFRDTLRQEGLSTAVIDYPAPTARTRGTPAAPWEGVLGQALSRLPSPLAVFTGGDDHALDVLAVCTLWHLPVPERVALLGCDNDELICPFAPIPISSVNTGMEDVAYHAAGILDGLLHLGPRPEQPILLPPRGIIVRASSGIIAIPDQRLLNAHTHIRNHCRDRNLDVQAIAEVAGVGPRMLNRIFQRHLHRSVGAELARVRLDQALMMLAGEHISVTQVALACGYSGLRQLRRALSRTMGTTPLRYRERVTS